MYKSQIHKLYGNFRELVTSSETFKMWKQISCLYSTVVFGVYCFVLPSPSLALREVGFPSSKDLVMFSSEISNNQDFQNKEFKALVKPLLIPRMPDTEGSTKVQDYIRTHFVNLNWEVEEDRFEDMTPYGRKSFTNIITTFEPQVKNKLVLSCHFDSKNMSDRSGNYFIAASDSAVPCAIMMDVAKKLDCALRQRKTNRRRSVADDVTLQMMFFDGEEAYKTWRDTDSLYGSRHLARKLKVTEDPYYRGTTRLDNVELFVLLDLIGTADLNFQSFFTKTDKYFKAMQKIEDKLAKKGLLNPKGLERRKRLFSNHRPWGAVEDDHKPFMKERQDLPVLHLISTPFPSVWHTMEDNESNINYDVTDNFNRILRVFVATYLKIPIGTCKH